MEISSLFRVEKRMLQYSHASGPIRTGVLGSSLTPGEWMLVSLEQSPLCWLVLYIDYNCVVINLIVLFYGKWALDDLLGGGFSINFEDRWALEETSGKCWADRCFVQGAYFSFTSQPKCKHTNLVYASITSIIFTKIFKDFWKWMASATNLN